MSQTRRVAATLAADVAGVFAADGAERKGRLERLQVLRRKLLDPKISERHSRIVKTSSDGLPVESASVVDTVHCAVEVQQAVPEGNAGVDGGPTNRFSGSASILC